MSAGTNYGDLSGLAATPGATVSLGRLQIGSSGLLRMDTIGGDLNNEWETHGSAAITLTAPKLTPLKLPGPNAASGLGVRDTANPYVWFVTGAGRSAIGTWVRGVNRLSAEQRAQITALFDDGRALVLPAVPTGATATANTHTQITTSWKDVTGALAYEVRKTAPGAIEAHPVTGTSRVWPGLSPGVTYTFQVRARNADGFSAWSANFQATTPVPDLVPTFGASSVADQTYVEGVAIAPLQLPAATGGDPPLSYALTPALPPGLRYDTAARRISGTPTAERARRQYTLTVTDRDGDFATLSFFVTVDRMAAPIEPPVAPFEPLPTTPQTVFRTLNIGINEAWLGLSYEGVAEGVYRSLRRILVITFGAAALADVGPSEGDALTLPLRKSDLPALALDGFTKPPQVVRREHGDREGIASTSISFDNEAQVLTLGITRGSLPKALTP